MNFEQVASDWVRALRGKRSQLSLSQRLGYQSNILYRWESGGCYPSAATFFRLAAACGRNVRPALQEFLRDTPPWLNRAALTTPDGVTHFLVQMRGATPLGELAARTGFSRYQVSRWLSGKTQPSLPEFLAMVSETTLRLLDFVNAFVDAGQLPSLRSAHGNLLASRELAYAMPWSHAVLKVLTLHTYTSRPHSDAWVAAQLGLPEAQVAQTLAGLSRIGHVRWDGVRFLESSPDVVDTRADPARARQLKTWWTKTALGRLEAGAPGVFAYNVSAVSRADLERLEQLQRQAYREMSRIIAESRDPDCVVLYAAQLTSLAAPEKALPHD